jgi:hypothetical protein
MNALREAQQELETARDLMVEEDFEPKHVELRRTLDGMEKYVHSVWDVWEALMQARTGGQPIEAEALMTKDPFRSFVLEKEKERFVRGFALPMKEVRRTIRDLDRRPAWA